MTAKNVLLTTFLVAKITDLGNSRIVNIQPGQLAQTLSRNPGTLVYMPPEALTAAAQYGPSLDIFSFGHLGVFVGLQVPLITQIAITFPTPCSIFWITTICVSSCMSSNCF
jgi:serine/threonine protein kinase